MNCGTCKHWKYDQHQGSERIGLCTCPSVLYRYVNHFPWRDDWKIYGIGKKESDKCEEWGNANLPT